MMTTTDRLVFEKISYKNFLSTGNVYTEIILNESKTTLLVGENGSGKSTMLDAISFALFGKPFRRLKKKTNLINSINKKDCVVKLDFFIGQDKYRIIRGMKPNIFEIEKNGGMIDQTSVTDYQSFLETFILKINHKSFLQIVAVGSATYVPFMQLKAAERRSIIEDLLDIQIFSNMNVVLKESISELKNELSELKLKKQNFTDSIHNFEIIKKNNIETSKSQIDSIEQKISGYKSILQKLKNDRMNHDKIMTNFIRPSDVNHKKLIKNVNDLIGIENIVRSKLEKAKESLNNLEKMDVCSTCKQPISEKIKEEKRKEFLEKIEKHSKGILEIEEELNKEKENLSLMEKEIQEFEENNKVYAVISTEEKTINEKIKDLISLKSEIQNKKTDSSIFVKGNKKYTLDEYIDYLKDNEKKCEETLSVKLELEFYNKVVYSLLKDSGIKTSIINHYIPIINKKIQKFLSAMNFNLSFSLDENFDELIKSRHYDEFEYENFSEGEKQKIDLALLFTWREIARLKNSISTNLLILDEIFDSSLDGSSTEDLVKILVSFGNNMNIFIISHKDPEFFENQFERCLSFEKKKNFSSYKEITNVVINEEVK